MKCPCPLGMDKFVPPEGSETPDFYFVGDAPGEEEVIQKRPFIGPSGQLLRDALAEAGIDLAVCRIFNSVACRPVSPDGRNRPPTDEEVANCCELVKADIRDHKPKKLIVCLGAVATKAILSHDGSMASILGVTRLWENIPTTAYYHPAYLLREGGKSSKEYENFVAFLRGLMKQDKVEVPLVEIVMGQYVPLLERLIKNEEEVGFDIESNGYPTTSQPFQVIGIGISTLKKSYYIPATNESILEHKDLWLKFMKKVRCLVYNMAYEGTVFSKLFGVSVHELNLSDVMQYAMLRQERASLKKVATIRGGLADWNIEVTTLNDIYTQLIAMLKPTKKYPRSEAILLEDKGFDALYDKLSAEKDKKDRTIQLLGLLSTLKGLLTPEELAGVIPLILKEAVNYSRRQYDKEVYFEWVPVRILAPYCGTDAFATIHLASVYRALCDEDENKAYDYFQSHARLATAIESSGIRWVEPTAGKLEKFYTEKQLFHIKSLLTNPLFAAQQKFPIHQMVEIKASSSVEDLIPIYNPNSPDARQTSQFLNALWTPRYRLCHFFRSLHKSFESGSLEQNHPLYTFTKTLNDDKEFKIRKSLFEGVLNDPAVLKETTDHAPYDWDVAQRPLTAFGLDAGVVEEIFTTLQLCGYNVDDPSCWCPEMDLLFHFRLYKKVSKALDVYINGKVGRQAVYTVKTSELDKPAPERCLFRPEIGTDEIHLLQPDYNYNGAETRRWRSAFHTIPSGSELKDLQASRWSDGVLLHVDYSQMEVRVMAALAEEESLIKAFESGVDVHRFVASVIYNKDKKDVTDDERRFAKTATFSVLYGKGEESFARDFMQGDVAKAQAFFADFFTKFPGLKKFIAHCHRSLHKNGWVKSMFGDKMWLKYDPKDKGEKGAAERNSQNAPIQSTASHLAGLGLYNLSRSLHEKKIPFHVWGFTHDAGDFDLHAKDLLTVLQEIHQHMVAEIRAVWKVPVEVDYEIGLTGSSTVGLKIKELTHKKLFAEFDGEKKDVEKIFAHLGTEIFGAGLSYALNPDPKKGSKTKYQSLASLFAPKQAFSMRFGTTTTTLNGTVSLIIP